MAVLVLHCRTVGSSGDSRVAEYVDAARVAGGCLEAEYYRKVGSRDQVAIVELWADDLAYSEFWAKSVQDNRVPEEILVGSGAADALTSGAGTEAYRHHYFHRPNGYWEPVDKPDQVQRIVWPAAGPVRVIIQGSRPADAKGQPGPAESHDETRREPGCLQFDGYRGIDAPGDTLLLELWQDQFAYDVHWQLRMRTRAAAGTSGPAPAAPAARVHGTNGMEFYRHQPFVHLYDRWLPVEAAARPQTISWPC